MCTPIKHLQLPKIICKSNLWEPGRCFAAFQGGLITAIRRWLRMIRIAVHIICGLRTVILNFPNFDQAMRNQRISRWSSQLTAMLGLQVKTFGIPPQCGQRTLILANHISWVDIFALNAISASRFVAKSEVSHWPVIGWLCKGAGTLFIERNNKRDTARLNLEIVAAFGTDQDIVIFPEGTTSDGTSLRPFRSSLLQPAIDCLATVQPVYLRYVDARGNLCRVAAYCDDISFGTSLWKLLAENGMAIELHYLEPISTSQSDDRKKLAHSIQSRIRTKQLEFNQIPRDSLQMPAPEISPHRPTLPQ